ncbi:hypothetical protein EJB05_11166 [Eragrostis curvula]|uniref:Uncharacterized protein n=1 Tax=Eragrostis curvula TaxID=38414 RepID=A0A5J9VQN2_9POAL|nr:hypothetical protein EJB05_11166 [Eragrostis curvula]
MTIMAHLNHHSCLFLLKMLKRRGWQTQPDDPYVISRTSKLLVARKTRLSRCMETKESRGRKKELLGRATMAHLNHRSYLVLLEILKRLGW